MQWVSVSLAVAAWAAVVYRGSRPGQSLTKPAFTAAGPTDAHNLRCIVLTALVATLYVPTISQWIDGLVGVAGFAATMMFALLVLGTGELLMALRCIATPPERVRAGRVARGAALAGVVGVLFLALLAGRPAQADVTVLWGADTSARAWMAVYWATWLAWCGYAGARAAWIAGGYARGGPDRIVRQALRLLVAGGSALAFYAATKAAVIAVVISGGGIPPLLTVATKLAVVVMGAAAVATSVWPTVGRAVRRRRIAGRLAQVTPLWQRLQPAGPELVVEVTGPGDDDAAVRLFRMCVEIVDWWVVLAQRLPPHAWSAAWRAAGDSGRDRAAVATAGWSEAGVRVQDSGRLPSAGGESPPVPAGSAELQRFVVSVARVSPVETEKVAAAVVMEAA